MPMYEIFIDGKPRKVELTRNGERSFNVKVDGKSMVVQLQAEWKSSEKRFSMDIDGKGYRIELPEISWEKPLQVKVDDAMFKAELSAQTAKTELASFSGTQPTPARKTGLKDRIAEGVITAPMTGKVVSVKVKKGDQVKANQVLCVIEAMKMENEINAPKAGAIKEVNVALSSSVTEGDVLFIIG
jgi:biotin carboxyl carrier protein